MRSPGDVITPADAVRYHHRVSVTVISPVPSIKPDPTVATTIFCPEPRSVRSRTQNDGSEGGQCAQHSIIYVERTKARSDGRRNCEADQSGELRRRRGENT